MVLDILEHLGSLGFIAEVHVDILGDGPGRSAFQRAATARGLESKVTLHGTQPSLERFYLNSFCLLTTSRWEGLPISVLEALSVGLPVVAANTPGNKDVVNASVGRLFAVRDPAAAARHLLALAQSPNDWHALSIAAVDLVRGKFSAKDMASQIYEIYENLAAEQALRAEKDSATGVTDGHLVVNSSKTRSRHRDLAYNVRTLGSKQSGVQRYAGELDSHFGASVTRLAPGVRSQGIWGHLWEQIVMPVRCGGRLLFSPGNTGPLIYKRQVVTIHDASTFDFPGAFKGLFGRWYRWLLPRLAKRVLGVITVSEFSKERIVATLGVAPDRVFVVYNGVTPPRIRFSPEQLSEISRRLGLPKRFLLFVGSHDPRKNVPRLLEAFAAAQTGDLELVLAGGGNGRLFSEGSAMADNPRVRVLGHVEEGLLEALYALAEGFVFPSLYEGFGLPPLEAMARGCPVLCSDATCLPEVCGPSLEKGGAPIYFAPAEVRSIAEALFRFSTLSHEAKAEMAAAGRRRAAQFTWARCAAETSEILGRFTGLPDDSGRRPASSLTVTQGLSGDN